MKDYMLSKEKMLLNQYCEDEFLILTVFCFLFIHI